MADDRMISVSDPLRDYSTVELIRALHPSTTADDGSLICATCYDYGEPASYPCATLLVLDMRDVEL